MHPFLSRTIASVVTSQALLRARRGGATLVRRVAGREASVHYFHQVDDPYSHLTAQTLARLAATYRVRLVPHLVPPPSDAAAADRQRLQAWSRIDARVVGGALGLEAPAASEQPGEDLANLANGALAAAIAHGGFVETCVAIGRAFWDSDRTRLEGFPSGLGASATAASLREGAALREKWGHYLGATFHYGGEWYWGADRLHYLEERLRAEGLAVGPDLIAKVPALAFDPLPAAATRSRPTLDFFCSFRSPYTYLALPRVTRLATHYGAELRLRFVLPMAMRGFTVPLAKRLYILRDAKREADSLGMPFGNVADPVGAPTERGLAVLHHATKEGRGPELAESFLRGVFAEGIDAGSDRGLRRIAERAGLDAASVDRALGDPSWRDVAEANRAELFSLGLWGVPSFRVNELPACWGQDRMWVIERDLRSA